MKVSEAEDIVRRWQENEGYIRGQTYQQAQRVLRQDKWDRRFLGLAAMVAGWSKDPSTKCGAAIVRPDLTIASVGYNGFPRGCSDAQEKYDDRELKLERVVHAELNAILSAVEPVRGYTMYTWPPGHGPSCARCTAHVIQAGIKRVVYVHLEEAGFSERWKRSCQNGLDMYQEAGVEIVAYRETNGGTQLARV
jgi:dCMP deaminase